MTWNYRIVRTVHNSPPNDPDVVFGIHEVFYHEDGTPRAVTVNSIAPIGDTSKELIQVLERMLHAVRRTRGDILEMSDFEKGGKYYEHNKTIKDDASDEGEEE